MARLLVKSEGTGLNCLELRMGVNRVGRDPKSDFPLNHTSVSSHHCELVLSADGVLLRDCQSTNGTFVNDRPVNEAWLETGQAVRFGDVELLVESTAAEVGIPAAARELPTPPPPPVVLPDGSMLCPRHPEYLATFRCPACGELQCTGCVRIIRMKGGKPHYLCLKCHNPCERITAEKPKEKKGIFSFLQDTVRLKFGGRPKD
jgi:pSer/pThr/pTyr-binding forkhead associated (FHA) protein